MPRSQDDNRVKASKKRKRHKSHYIHTKALDTNQSSFGVPVNTSCSPYIDRVYWVDERAAVVVCARNTLCCPGTERSVVAVKRREKSASLFATRQCLIKYL